MASVSAVEPDITEDDKKSALGFALQSDSLCRSDRLKSLLRFICEAELSEQHHRLTEYEIAVSALGRRGDFSPVEDSTVRSRAYELRQKLDKLYTVEAPHYPIRIDLPKGSYRPRFYRVPPPPVERTEVSPAPALEKPRWSLQRVGVASFLGGIVVASLVAGLISVRHAASSPVFRATTNDGRWTPELRQLWAPFLTGSRPLLVIFETRLFVGVGPLIVRDPEIESIHDLESSAPIMQVKRLFDVPQVYEARHYSDFSVASALFSLAKLLSPTGVPLRAKRSEEITNDDIHSSNLILLGKPGAYDELNEISPGSSDFAFGKDRNIRNLHPAPGEPQVYARTVNSAVTGDLVQDYGIMIMKPGPEKDQRILSLIGAESELFSSLGSYVSDPVFAKDLVDHVRLPSGKLPDAFEVIIKAEFHRQGAGAISYVTHRVLPSR